MNDENMQKTDIAAIKKRRLILNLSDADVARLCERTAGVGLTPEKLLENFIGDLVDGTFSNGSDERMYANQWFERCWFSLFPENTFLRYLTEAGKLNEIQDCLEEVELLEMDIRCTMESLERGTVESMDGFITWKDLTYSDGKQCYKSREAWEDKERKDLEFYRHEAEKGREMIRNEWESYRQWKHPDTETGTLAEELQKLKAWTEHCRAIEEEYVIREDAEALEEKQLQEREQAPLSMKKAR